MTASLLKAKQEWLNRHSYKTNVLLLRLSPTIYLNNKTAECIAQFLSWQLLKAAMVEYIQVVVMQSGGQSYPQKQPNLFNNGKGGKRFDNPIKTHRKVLAINRTLVRIRIPPRISFHAWIRMFSHKVIIPLKFITFLHIYFCIRVWPLKNVSVK